MNKLKILALVVITGAVAYSIGRYATPPKVEVKEVERVVYKERSDYNRDVTRRETIRPDGTRIIEHDSSTRRSTDKSLDKETSKEVKTEQRPNWLIGVTYEPLLITIQDQNVTLHVQRRLFSEVYLGVSASTQRTIGISLGVGF